MFMPGSPQLLRTYYAVSMDLTQSHVLGCLASHPICLLPLECALGRSKTLAPQTHFQRLLLPHGLHLWLSCGTLRLLPTSAKVGGVWLLWAVPRSAKGWD